MISNHSRSQILADIIGLGTFFFKKFEDFNFASVGRFRQASRSILLGVFGAFGFKGCHSLIFDFLQFLYGGFRRFDACYHLLETTRKRANKIKINTNLSNYIIGSFQGLKL